MQFIRSEQPQAGSSTPKCFHLDLRAASYAVLLSMTSQYKADVRKHTLETLFLQEAETGIDKFWCAVLSRASLKWDLEQWNGQNLKGACDWSSPHIHVPGLILLKNIEKPRPYGPYHAIFGIHRCGNPKKTIKINLAQDHFKCFNPLKICETADQVYGEVIFTASSLQFKVPSLLHCCRAAGHEMICAKLCWPTSNWKPVSLVHLESAPVKLAQKNCRYHQNYAISMRMVLKPWGNWDSKCCHSPISLPKTLWNTCLKYGSESAPACMCMLTCTVTWKMLITSIHSSNFQHIRMPNDFMVRICKPFSFGLWNWNPFDYIKCSTLGLWQDWWQYFREGKHREWQDGWRNHCRKYHVEVFPIRVCLKMLVYSQKNPEDTLGIATKG